MENSKKHNTEEEKGAHPQRKKHTIHENEAEQGDQYANDQGEDENGPKPSADEQE